MGFIDIIVRFFAGLVPQEPTQGPPRDNRLDQEAPPLPPEKPSTSEPAHSPKAREFKDRFQDRRPHASKKHDFGPRKWSEVTGICLHQTACVLGTRPARWDTVGAHYGVPRDGSIIQMHNEDRKIVHGNGFNNQTVGIEIDGMYAGIKNDLKTFWRPKDEPNRQPQHPTEEQIEAACQLISHIVAKVKAAGGEIKVIVAHRQASKDRRSDPGEELWKAVGLRMIKELGLGDGGRGFKISTGYAIPEAWDPEKKGIKY